MKKIFAAAIMILATGGAYAADFRALGVKASGLNNLFSAGYITVPDVTKVPAPAIDPLSNIARLGLFNTVGKVASFQWAPERYASNFRYDIFYYIPKNLSKNPKASALIFTHGGGASTMDRPGSIAAVEMYMDDLKRVAEELGIIVVLPSANGLNWGAHTRGMLRDLVALMGKQLDIDVDRIGLSGHSMGGMGITRSFLWLADRFAFFLPMAAGMDEKGQSEYNLNKVFNVPYVHLQGTGDHFSVFLSRTREQLKRTQALEAAYKVPSKLKIVFYEGSHNYDYGLFKSNLSALITNSPRDLYQKELWGSLHTIKTVLTENNIPVDFDSVSRYFWIEARDIDLSEQERVDFHAKIRGNTINIDMPLLPKRTKALRIYLHSKMINLNQPIEVRLNDKAVATRAPRAGSLRNMDANDPGFNFEDFIDLKLP